VHDADDVPALVTLHVWGVSRAVVPTALVRMARDRTPLRRTPGLRFGKLLGTGRGRTFTVGDADPLHWGLLGAWSSADAAAAFEHSPTVQAWDRLSRERLLLSMRPVSSRGQWSGRRPFGDPSPHRHDGPVAALTRARIAPSKSLMFWRSVPPVSADLHRSRGLRFALGLGEAPVGLQGTFSVWDSATALADFAHRGAPHAAAVQRTAEVGWYTEELFARFAVLSVQGTYEGATP
jgi:hypothetical protein